MNKTIRIWSVTLAAAFIAAAALAAQTTFTDGEEYVVYVEALNLRAEAGADGARVKVLKRGYRVVNLSDEITVISPEPGYVSLEGAEYWRRVRAGDAEGWVNDFYVMPATLYDDFSEADTAAREGGSRWYFLDCVARPIVRAGLDRYGYDLYNGCPAAVSPDREKVVVRGFWTTEPEADGEGDWGGGYPAAGRVCSPFPVLVLVFGRGLVAYWRSYDELYIWWSSDSRYCALVAEPVAEYQFRAGWRVMDTATWEEVGDGGCEEKPLPGRHEYDVEFAGDYFLYFDREPADRFPAASPPLDPDYWSLPVVKGFNARTGESKRFLVADPATVKKNVAENFAYVGEAHEVKMVPADAAPEAVTNSDIYGRYNGRVAYALDSEGAGE